MANSTRVPVWFLVMVLGLLVICALAQPGGVLLLYFLYVLTPVPYWLVQNYYSPVMTLVTIPAGLGLLYYYLADKVYAAWGDTGRTRLRLTFAAAALLILLAFTFTEYSKSQDRQIISDICRQFDQAMARGEYEAAYALLSPNYRQSHSLEELIASKGREVASCTKRDKKPVVILDKGGEAASLLHYPYGSLNWETRFEKVGQQWYLKGEVSGFQF